jgi:hypothetical protein
MSVRLRAALLTLATLVAVASPVGSALAAGRPVVWAVVPTPNTTLKNNGLYGVSCASPSACMAVGYAHGQIGRDRTVAESWDGTAWSIVHTKDKASYNELNGVYCPSASDCIAVGDYYRAENEPRTLIESWDGTDWDSVPSPNPATGLGQDYLRGVYCTSAEDCTAVGFYQDHPGVPRTLAESWDGTTWSVVPTPDPQPGLQGAGFSGVSCSSAASCMAVGHYNSTGDPEQTVAESWNGHIWSIVPSQDEGSEETVLLSVSCPTATACMAVGQYTNTGGQEQTVTESWDGKSWSIVASPDAGPSGSANVLDSVSCTSARDCIAVGSYQPSGRPAHTLIESWNGTTWSIVSSPNAGSAKDDNIVDSISCISPMACVAAGSYGLPPHGKTLVETGTSSPADGHLRA